MCCSDSKESSVSGERDARSSLMGSAGILSGGRLVVRRRRESDAVEAILSRTPHGGLQNDDANRQMSAEKTPNYDWCEVKDSQECTRCEDRIYMRLTAKADE